MIFIVVISYLLAGAINLGYGHYYKVGVNLVVRAYVYPFLQLLTELPNILTMYAIHWDSYKPSSLLERSDSDPHESQTAATEQWGQTSDDELESRSHASSFLSDNSTNRGKGIGFMQLYSNRNLLTELNR